MGCARLSTAPEITGNESITVNGCRYREDGILNHGDPALGNSLKAASVQSGGPPQRTRVLCKRVGKAFCPTCLRPSRMIDFGNFFGFFVCASVTQIDHRRWELTRRGLLGAFSSSRLVFPVVSVAEWLYWRDTAACANPMTRSTRPLRWNTPHLGSYHRVLGWRWKYLKLPGKSRSSSVCSRNVRRLCALSPGGTTVPYLCMVDLQKNRACADYKCQCLNQKIEIIMFWLIARRVKKSLIDWPTLQTEILH